MRPLAVHSWLGHWLHPWQHAEVPQAPEHLLQRARAAVRAHDVALAESLLEECGEAIETDPDCLNLRGLLAELRGQWTMARRYWVRAAGHSLAATQNLRRYFELWHFGCTKVAIAFGDEPEFQVYRMRRGHDW
jgi:hypothetical protein